MKLSPGYNLIGDWRLFLTTSLTCLSILHRSEVSGATVNVISPSISNFNSSYSSKQNNPPPAPPSPPNINQPEGLEEGIENQILAEILRLDSLKCFPKLLCTIYQDKEITRQGFFVNATQLALAYIKLIRAVHYTSPKRRTTTTEAPTRKKQPIIQIFKIPLGLITASTYQGRRSPLKRHPHKHHHHRLEADEYDPDEEQDDFQQDYPYHSRSPLSFRDQDDNDDEDDHDSFPYGRRTATRDDRDDEEREFLREKVRMTQLMKDLKDEDNAEMEAPESGGLATTLLSSFLPFVGSGSRREEKSLVLAASNAEPPKPTHSRRSGRRRSRKTQDPFWKAVKMWRKLKRRSQCQSMYKTCPMEAWEIVRMLDLVKGQSQVLATYLKITVDNVKPKPRRKSH